MASIFDSWTNYAGTGSYTYGTLETDVETQEHDWLFVAVSFVVSSGVQAQDVAPIAFACDNAHNLYQTPGLVNDHGLAQQLFIAPNARQATTIYVSTSAFVEDLTVSIVDVEGLIPGYYVDYAVTYSSGAGTNTGFTTSGTASDTDFEFACVAYATNATISQSSGWTSISGAGISHTPLSQGCFWNTTSGAGSWSIDYSQGGTAAQARAITVGLIEDTSTSTYPATYTATYEGSTVVPFEYNDNPGWPEINVQVAFGFTPQLPAGVPDWTDITADYLGLTGQRGRDFELDELAPADYEITLSNELAQYDPTNVNSPYYPNVTMMTPIRILATWQGRQYSLFTGYIQSWDQTFDFQRGEVTASITDAFSKLPQVLLQSCQIQEMLYDNPTYCWPLNDASNAIAASNYSGLTSDTLVVRNTKGVAQGGTYQFGQDTEETNTNNTAQGSQDTVAQQATPKANDNQWGQYLYGLINGLPPLAAGATYEWKAQYSTTNDFVGANYVVPFELVDNAQNYALSVQVYSTWGAFITASINVFVGGNPNVSGTLSDKAYDIDIFDGNWHHYCITTTSSSYTFYMDGTALFTESTKWPTSPITQIDIGGDGLAPNGGIGGTGNAFFCDVAAYPYALDPARVQSHANSILTGFVNETSGPRIQRFLNYSKWAGGQAVDTGTAEQQQLNYLATGGYGVNLTGGSVGDFGVSASGAPANNGSQADEAIDDVVASENGIMFIDNGCNLIFRQRSSRYNQTATQGFGDGDIPYNATTDFIQGTVGEWTDATNCTVTLDTGTWGVTEFDSALITCSGSGTQATARGNYYAVTPGAEIGASVWLMSPQGCTATLGIDFWDGVTYESTQTAGTTTLPPWTPVFLNFTTTVPAGITRVQFGPTVLDSPSSSITVQFDAPRLSATGFTATYLEDIEADYDVQFLYNDITATRNVDNASLRLVSQPSVAKFFPRTYTLTVYTAQDDSTALSSLVGWLLNAYSQPAIRIARMNVDCAANPYNWDFVLKTDVGDVVSFSRTPLWSGVTISGNFMVEQIEPSLGPDEAEFSYVLIPVLAPAFQLDSATYGTVGEGNVLAI